MFGLAEVTTNNGKYCNHTLVTVLEQVDSALFYDLYFQVVKEISELHSWEEQLDKTLQILRRRAEVRDEVWPKYKKSLTALRNHLTAVLAYKPQNHLFKGSMHLIRPKSASDINFCGLQLVSLW